MTILVLPLYLNYLSAARYEEKAASSLFTTIAPHLGFYPAELRPCRR
jgi:hypothetical protein